VSPDLLPWIVLGVVVLGMLALDLFVFRRVAHEVKLREAAAWSVGDRAWPGLRRRGVRHREPPGRARHGRRRTDPPHDPAHIELSAGIAA